MKECGMNGARRLTDVGTINYKNSGYKILRKEPTSEKKIDTGRQYYNVFLRTVLRVCELN